MEGVFLGNKNKNKKIKEIGKFTVFSVFSQKKFSSKIWLFALQMNVKTI